MKKRILYFAAPAFLALSLVLLLGGALTEEEYIPKRLIPDHGPEQVEPIPPGSPTEDLYAYQQVLRPFGLAAHAGSTWIVLGSLTFLSCLLGIAYSFRKDFSIRIALILFSPQLPGFILALSVAYLAIPKI